MIIEGHDRYLDGPLKGQEIPAAVLQEKNSTFNIYRKDLFVKNCANLRDAVKRKKQRSKDDNLAIAKQIATFPRAQFHTSGVSAEVSGIASDKVITYPVWSGHIAQQLLRYDIQRGILKAQYWNEEESQWEKMFPRNLKKTRPAYKLWPLKIFRDHIHKEIKAIKQDHWNRDNGVYGYIPPS
jgi:hypothetical protein